MSRGDVNSAAADAGAASEASTAALSELPALIARAMAGDQFRLSQRLRSIRQAQKDKKPFGPPGRTAQTLSQNHL